MPRRSPLAAAALVVLFTVAGCGADATPAPAGRSSAPAGPSSAPATPDAWGDPPRATAGGRAGPGSACPTTPVFDVADGWEPADLPPSVTAGVSLAGPFRPICEIDGKPAGVTGFIRVWRADLQPHGSMEADGARFVREWRTDGMTGVESRPVKGGTAQGHEFRYPTRLDGTERAFAFRVASMVFVLTWTGLLDDEHEKGLPAYVLARDSIAIP